MNNENFERCKHIADTIRAYAIGEKYKCPECGEHIDEVSYFGDTETYHFPCGCESEYEPETLGLWDYFEYALDIDYIVASDRKTLKAVRVMMACGGPNIYINTWDKQVELYWWSESATYPLETWICDEITEFFVELWEC